MRIAFDAVMLSAVLHPDAAYPYAVDRTKDRLSLLVEQLERANAKVVIPTPILSEFLVLAGNAGPEYLSEMANSDLYEIQPFDTLAAVEAAAQMMSAMAAGDKRAGSKQRWQVVKVDREAMAIAKVHRVSCVYSDDSDFRPLAEAAGITVKGMADLPLPPPPKPRDADLFEEGAVNEDAPSAPQPPSGQSASDAQPKASEPAQPLPAAPRADQAPRPRGSSPSPAPPSPSTQSPAE